MLAGLIGAIGRQDHFADLGGVGLITDHIDGDGARIKRHGTPVVARHHREGTQGVDTRAVGIGRWGPIGLDAAIDQRIASSHKGRSRLCTGSQLQGTAEDFAHLQLSHRAVDISNLALSSSRPDQVAKEHFNRTVFCATDKRARDQCEGGSVINRRKTHCGCHHTAAGSSDTLRIGDLETDRAACTGGSGIRAAGAVGDGAQRLLVVGQRSRSRQAQHSRAGVVGTGDDPDTHRLGQGVTSRKASRDGDTGGAELGAVAISQA